MKERTLALIKPDAVRKRVIGRIITIIEEAGLEIEAMKMVRLSLEQAAEFYSDHRKRPYFLGLINHMSSGPLVAMVLAGENAIERWRALMGETDPFFAKKGTIRNLFGSRLPCNAVHGSDSPEAAEREIRFFFPKGQ